MGLFDKLFSAFKKSSKDVEDQLDDAAKVVMKKAGEFKDIAAEKMEEMAPMVEQAKEKIAEKMEDAGEVLGDVKEKATAKFEEFSNAAEKDAKETAEKGDNLEELMENNHLDALKNTKLTGEHKGQPIEDAVTERIDELKGHTSSPTTAKEDYNQDLVLPDLPNTDTEAIATPPPTPDVSDEIEGLIEAPDSEEVSLPTVDKLEDVKSSVTDKVEEAKEGLTDSIDNASKKITDVGAGIAGAAGGLGTDLKDKADAALGDTTEKLEDLKSSMDEKLQETKDGLADKMEAAKGKIAGVGAGIAGAAGGLTGSDLKDKADAVLGDTKAQLDDTLSKAKELGSELEDQANAIKEKHLKAVENLDTDSLTSETIEEVEAIEVEPEEKDPNDEPSFGDLVDDAKDALFGFKDSINKKID